MADRIAVQRNRRRKTIYYYAVIAAVLVVLITAAFFAPQILFQVQDAILCKDTVLTQQESMNVEALSTTYEQSLGTRMQNYAEGLAAGNAFYVTSTNNPLTEEVTEYIYSNQGIYSNLPSTLAEIGLLPYTIWGEVYTVEEWKQYVIYSNDFTKGVNFILWYVQMRDENGVLFKLLADAEDGTIYAIKTEENGQHDFMDGQADKARNYLEDLFWSDEYAMSVWGFGAQMYEALDPEYIKEFEILMNEYGATFTDFASALNGQAYGDTSIQVEEMDAFMKEHEELIDSDGNPEMWADILRKARYYMEEGDTMVFQLPYGDARLDLVFDIPILGTETTFIYGCPDITVGIRQIYEMIPEFA